MKKEINSIAEQLNKLGEKQTGINPKEKTVTKALKYYVDNFGGGAPSTAVWGNITGDISNQRDLIDTVDDMISDELANFEHISYKVADSVPTPTEVVIGGVTEPTQEGVRYLVKHPTENVYEEYILIGGVIYDIGSTESMDLINYLQKTDVVDNLTSTETQKPLSAKQGKILKDLVDENKHLDDNEVIFDNLSEVIRNGFRLDINNSEELELTWTEGKFYSHETGEPINNSSTKSTVVNVNPGEIYFVYGVKWSSLYPALLCNDTEVLNYWGEPTYQTFLIKIPYGANNLKINSRVYTGVTVTKLYKLNSINISNSIKNEILNEAKGFGFNRWFAIGDSITASTYKASKNYVDYIEEDMGITCVNLGLSSSGYKQPSAETFAERIQHITDYNLNNDVITVMGGINDRGYSAPQYLGALGDTTTDTFYGAVYVFFNTLFTAYPGCRVGLIEPIPSTIEPNIYSNLIKALNDTAELFNVPVLHLHSTSNLRPNEETFRNLYFKADGEGAEGRGYPVDGTHPNSLGHKIFANRIKEFIKSL